MVAEVDRLSGGYYAVCVEHEWNETLRDTRREAFEDANTHNLVNHLPEWLTVGR